MHTDVALPTYGLRGDLDEFVPAVEPESGGLPSRLAVSPTLSFNGGSRKRRQVRAGHHQSQTGRETAKKASLPLPCPGALLRQVMKTPTGSRQSRPRPLLVCWSKLICFTNHPAW